MPSDDERPLTGEERAYFRKLKESSERREWVLKSTKASIGWAIAAVTSVAAAWDHIKATLASWLDR